MKVYYFCLLLNLCTCIRQHDAFDETLAVFTSSSTDDRGWDETNDYDKESELPENVQYDDPDWKGF